MKKSKAPYYLFLMLIFFSSCIRKPEASIQCYKSTGSPGEIISIFNNSVNADNFYWDFGDGCTSDGKEEESGFMHHSYSKTGTYTITVTAYNKNIDKGDSQSITLNIIENQTGTFTDPRDGQVYKTIKINNVLWMAENLNYKTAEGCWDYNDDTINGEIYGKLYNQETSKNVAPPGWHLASEDEWDKLIYLYGSLSNVAGKLKDTLLWDSPNTGANNVSGFSVLPGGYRHSYCSYLGFRTMFWTSDEGRSMMFENNNESIIKVGCPNEYGCYVRCVSDELFLE